MNKICNMKTAYLICVAVKNRETLENTNHNKYYQMTQTSSEDLFVEYGRVGGTFQTKRYHIREWNRIYNQKTTKIRNGYIYKDITEMKAIGKVVKKFADIDDPKVASFIESIIDYSNKSVSKNYNIASAGVVTQLQIITAQEILDELALRSTGESKIKLGEFNEKLIELFQIIPRKMDKVSEFLLNSSASQDLIGLVTREQDALDALAGSQQLSKSQDETEDVSKTILDILGITIENVTENDEFYIKKQMGNIRNKYSRAFKIVNTQTQLDFDKFWQENLNQQHMDKKRKMLWHGSRNQNWLSIIQNGLKIRPAGVQLTGAMFGNGVYFAPSAGKSMGYTSVRGSYWASGRAGNGLIALYDVNMGRPLIIDSHKPWCYNLDKEKLRLRGRYDSLHAKAGNSLRNDEVIIYNPKQSTVSFLVEIK